MPAQFQHRGCKIFRDPVPIDSDDGLEQALTSWEFTAIDPVGQPIPVNVTARNRFAGLDATKRRIDKYLKEMEMSVAEPSAHVANELS